VGAVPSSNGCPESFMFEGSKFNIINTANPKPRPNHEQTVNNPAQPTETTPTEPATTTITTTTTAEEATTTTTTTTITEPPAETAPAAETRSKHEHTDLEETQDDNLSKNQNPRAPPDDSQEENLSKNQQTTHEEKGKSEVDMGKKPSNRGRQCARKRRPNDNNNKGNFPENLTGKSSLTTKGKLQKT